MDFKRPTPTSYANETRQVAPPPAAPVSESPAPQVVKKTSKRYKILSSLLLILLIVATGYAVYSYMNEQQLRSELDGVKSELSSLKDGKDSVVVRAQAAEDAAKINSDLSEKAQQTRATSAASAYYCLLENFGCDKVSSVVTKFQEVKIAQGAGVTQEGLAIVTATPASSGAGAKFYVKSRDGLNWVVIYDGQNVPPEDVAKKFAIPQSFR